MIKAVRNRRHLALLIVLLTVAILEPLAARINERVLLVGVSVAVVINVGVLMVIFERRCERFLGVFLSRLYSGRISSMSFHHMPRNSATGTCSASFLTISAS
jgi:hypothetical protein